MRVDSVDSPGLRAQIEARLREFSRKQRAVAEYVLEHPTNVMFASAGDLARWAEVDPATVVRFAQRLGFAGHTEFRDALRAEFTALASPLERLDDEVAPVANDVAGVFARVRTQTLANVERTFGELDPAVVGAAVDALLGAERCVIFGSGQSRALTMQLQMVLATAGIRTHRLDGWSDVEFEVTTFGPRDVAFGISVWHYTKSTIEGLRLAHEAGASTILLTDIAFAPGTDFADMTLLFAPQAMGEYLSPAAGAVVIDCLAAALATRVPDQVKRAMARQYELSLAFGLSYG